MFSQPIEVPSAREQLRAAVGRRGIPQMVLRLGFGRPGQPTPRRPVNEVLEDNPDVLVTKKRTSIGREGDAMKAIRQWRVEILIGEDDGRTYAEARLISDTPIDLVGIGWARLSSHDADVPEIGDEVAVARALRQLGTRMLDTASDDIHDITHEDVHLTH